MCPRNVPRSNWSNSSQSRKESSQEVEGILELIFLKNYASKTYVSKTYVSKTHVFKTYVFKTYVSITDVFITDVSTTDVSRARTSTPFLLSHASPLFNGQSSRHAFSDVEVRTPYRLKQQKCPVLQWSHATGQKIKLGMHSLLSV